MKGRRGRRHHFWVWFWILGRVGFSGAHSGDGIAGFIAVERWRLASLGAWGVWGLGCNVEMGAHEAWACEMCGRVAPDDRDNPVCYRFSPGLPARSYFDPGCNGNWENRAAGSSV